MEAINLYLFCTAGDKLYMRYPYWKGYFEDDFKVLVKCLDLNKPAILYALKNNDIEDKTIAELYAKAITGENINTLIGEYNKYREFKPVKEISAYFRKKAQEREEHFQSIMYDVLAIPAGEIKNYL